jgi:isochorismate hydrolase
LLGIEPSTASTSDSVLVIIDAQNEYATGKLKIENIEASRPVIASLLEKYRAAKAPVVHVVHTTPSGAPVFTPDTELAEEFDELKPTESEKVVEKSHPGSFTGTDLQEVLTATGRSKIVLVGYMVSSLMLASFWRTEIRLLRPTSAFQPLLVRALREDGMFWWRKMRLAIETSPASTLKS